MVPLDISCSCGWCGTVDVNMDNGTASVPIDHGCTGGSFTITYGMAVWPTWPDLPSLTEGIEGAIAMWLHWLGYQSRNHLRAPPSRPLQMLAPARPGRPAKRQRGHAVGHSPRRKSRHG